MNAHFRLGGDAEVIWPSHDEISTGKSAFELRNGMSLDVNTQSKQLRYSL
jgi:hypothetical protein